MNYFQNLPRWMVSKAFLKSINVITAGRLFAFTPSISLVSARMCHTVVLPTLKPLWLVLRRLSSSGLILFRIILLYVLATMELRLVASNAKVTWFWVRHDVKNWLLAWFLSFQQCIIKGLQHNIIQVSSFKYFRRNVVFSTAFSFHQRLLGFFHTHPGWKAQLWYQHLQVLELSLHLHQRCRVGFQEGS